jgi:signal transduction histidine kinase
MTDVPTHRGHPRLAFGGTVVILAGTLAAASVSSDADDWRPTSLLLVLTGFAVASQLMPIELRPRSHPLRGWYFSSTAPFVLAAVCLGPAPAVALAFVALAVSTVIERTPWRYAVANASDHGVFALTAGLLAELAVREFNVASDDPAFALLVVVAYAYILILNLAQTAGSGALWDGEPIREAVPWLWRGQVIAEAPIVVVTGFTPYIYATSGLAALAVLAVVQLWFAYGARELHRSIDRADRVSELSASRGRLVGQILTAEESERRRLAETLHDGPVQNLLAASQDLSEALRTPGIMRARGAVDATVDQLREAISDLHPAVLAHVGLPAAIKSIAIAQARRAGFDVTTSVDPNVPTELEGLVFTISRELISNSAKHSGATLVVVRVARVDDAVRLIVTDNGRGFAGQSLGAALDRGHIGLASISERIEALGGRFEIDSQSGHGTRVSVILPAKTAHDVVTAGIDPVTTAAEMIPATGPTASGVSAAGST